MRILTLVAALSVIANTSTIAQAPMDNRPAQQSAQQAPEPAPDQNVTAINIVRFEDLDPQFKSVIETKLRDTSEEDLRELKASIQTSPVAMTMLSQNGVNVTQVVAAAVDPTGTLTLVIQDTA